MFVFINYNKAERIQHVKRNADQTYCIDKVHARATKNIHWLKEAFSYDSQKDYKNDP